MAGLGEVERGKLTEGDLATAFGLDAGEQTELATLAARIKAPLESYCLGGRVTLTNVGTSYDAGNDSRSLPFLYLQRAGVTRIDLEVRARKVGSGTQDWQLWDETNAEEVLGPGTLTSGSLSDAGAAADRTLGASRVFGTALTAQVVKLRLRCKSSAAADDPVFLGAALLLFRVDRLTAVELHEVLCLAEGGEAYAAAAALKARLGVS